jgi:HSP20 family protein
MLRMQENINQVFRKHLDEMNSDTPACNWTPLADIFETDKDFIVRLELPGVQKEDVKMDFNENVITISGERKHSPDLAQENFLRMECISGKFSRSFSLPQHVNSEKIEGALREGVLSIRIPKSEKAQKKTIPISGD